MFDRIAPRYDRVNQILTVGMDKGWRRRAVRALGLEPGSLVFDVGCGTGMLSHELVAAGQRVVGFDISEGMMRAAAGPLRMVLADGVRLPVADGAADGVTCGFALRNVVDPAALLREAGRVLRPGGTLSVLEVAEPTWRPARAVHHAYFHRVVPVIGGVLSDRPAYRYLPASVSLLPGPSEFGEMARASGFGAPVRRRLGLGAAQLLVATRLPGPLGVAPARR
jgi:demethylmenaquinone methyltransferase/2-methoxy-6-polyprenyl-1,4-benzoquinol methylase